MVAVVLRTFALFALAAFLAGCTALLPRSKAETDATWKSFEEARLVVDGIQPYKTTRADLKAAGIGTERDPTITLLSHVDIAVRFPIGGVLREEDVDRGIRDCLKAGKGCNAYQINVNRTNRDRVGNFWLDAFRFRRETDVNGWTFNARRNVARASRRCRTSATSCTYRRVRRTRATLIPSAEVPDMTPATITGRFPQGLKPHHFAGVNGTLQP